jgi:hypothetical protein
MAKRGVVVLAVVDHQAAGSIGAHKECFSQYMLATFGRTARVAGDT